VPLGSVDVLFLTHYHSDHTVGVPDLWLTGWLAGPPWGNRKTSFNVIGPIGAKSLMDNLEKAYALDIKIRHDDEQLPLEGVAVKVEEFAKDGMVYEKSGVKVIAFGVHHGDLIKPSVGYRIEYKGHSAVISGDTTYDENVIRYGAGADVLIHEVAMARPALMQIPSYQRILAHHTAPKEAGLVFSRAKPKLAVYTHFVLAGNPPIPAPTVDDVIAETRQTYSGPLEAGEDLTSFEIGDTVTVLHLKP
jgi:ribonuclease Z